MRRLGYFVASTLDGFIAAPDGAVGFFPFSVDSDLAQFIRAEFPETLPTALRQALSIPLARRAFGPTVLALASMTHMPDGVVVLRYTRG